MFNLRRVFYITAISIVILSLLAEETEARRKVLRGRKTITRKYYRGLGIPAWSIVVIVGFGMALIGGLLYFILQKIFLSDPSEEGYVTTNSEP